jgi:hypothetical protein
VILAHRHTAQLAAILRMEFAGGIVREPGEHGHLVSGPDPMASKFRHAGGRCSSLGREILRDVEDLHDVEGSWLFGGVAGL